MCPVGYGQNSHVWSLGTPEYTVYPTCTIISINSTNDTVAGCLILILRSGHRPQVMLFVQHAAFMMHSPFFLTAVCMYALPGYSGRSAHSSYCNPSFSCSANISFFVLVHAYTLRVRRYDIIVGMICRRSLSTYSFLW